MKIVAVRHGQTEGNVQKIIQSRTGGKLTEVGIDQAVQTAQKLKGYTFDKIYCSTLDRCKETLGYITESHAAAGVEYSSALVELDKGELEGKSWDALPEYFFSEAYVDKSAPGGESWLDLDVRLRTFLNDIYEPDSTVLVVTHEGPIKVLHAILKEIPLGEAVQVSYENAGIYELDMNTRIPEEAVA